MERKKQEAKSTPPVFPLLLLFLNLEHLTAVVHAASLAGTMGQVISAAVGAGDDTGGLELPNVGTSLIASCLRSFSLGYCHGDTSYVNSWLEQRLFYIQKLS